MSDLTYAFQTKGRPIQTVLGAVLYETLGITDAHNHLWIEAIPGAVTGSPVLDQPDIILQELMLYRQANGATILDCQPGRCGRNANRLAEFSQKTDVTIIACTGFHLKKYYSFDEPFWSWPADKTAQYFIDELTYGLPETASGPLVMRAGFIKIALEATLAETPTAALEGAAYASAQTRAMIEIHTEKGAAALETLAFFQKHGVQPGQLVLCHMDKRPDFGLHRELANAGVLLEYDTFYRPKYLPEQGVWPLIDLMLGAGLDSILALATDMAEPGLYSSLGHSPGLAGLPGDICSRLRQRGVTDSIIRRLTGGNIARRLAGLNLSLASLEEPA
jgi:phosphotriesterase-related protein